jgi:ATP phosphoribosyltransferase regulatory subunit HisZ
VSAAEVEQQVNLYQPILGAEKRLFSARAIGVCLALLALSLAALGGYGAWRTSRVERSVAELEKRQAAELVTAERAGLALNPGKSLADLDADAKNLAADIAARERALAILKIGAASPATGFAARLDALARRQVDGLWLHDVVVGSGDGRLAMRGQALDPKLVPAYLAALSEDPALAGVRFDKLTMRRAKEDEAPAELVFELGAPGLTLATPEARP